MAVGGMGDVLSGLIGGIAAGGVELELATAIGVSVHSEAAEIERELGVRGMLPSDLFLHVRTLLNE